MLTGVIIESDSIEEQIMSLANAIQKEKEALIAEQADIRNQIGKLEAKEAIVITNLKAIGAYEHTLAPKPKVEKSAPTKRAPKGSKRDAIIEVITQKKGAARGAILEALGAKGDKAAEQSISNALANMAKANQLVRSKEGVYTMP